MSMPARGRKYRSRDCDEKADTTGGNWSTQRKSVMLAGVKLYNILLTCDKGRFHQITAWSQDQTLLTVMGDRYTTTVPPAPPTSL